MRRTVRRLRMSVIAVVVATIAFTALTIATTRDAWRSGHAAGVKAASPAQPTDPARGASAMPIASRPSSRTTGEPPAEARSDGPGDAILAASIGGAALIGLALFVVVRRPLAAARQQAVDLVRAESVLHDSTLETFAALGAAVEAKDRYTAGHGLRVTLISILIGQEMGLKQADLDVLRLAATFHDIGKIAVPDQVLQNPGRLSDSEFEAMKVHPVEGARICSKLQSLRATVPAVRSHHERIDGRGYPDGLVGEAIPLGARIIAVADTWDAITSDRPYRPGQPGFVALEEIRRCAGSQFDERVVRAFVEVLAKDPWMFGLSPEDVSADARPLPAPVPASRGTEVDERGGARIRDILLRRRDRTDIDWSNGLDDDDIRAA